MDFLLGCVQVSNKHPCSHGLQRVASDIQLAARPVTHMSASTLTSEGMPHAFSQQF